MKVSKVLKLFIFISILGFQVVSFSKSSSKINVIDSMINYKHIKENNIKIVDKYTLYEDNLDSVVISNKDISTINKIISKYSSDYNIKIISYVDLRIGTKNNLELGINKAKEIKKYLDNKKFNNKITIKIQGNNYIKILK